MAFCGRDSIDPWAVANVAFVQWVFGAQSTTVANLAGSRTETISRAIELGFWRIYISDIETARSRYGA